jgi:hypothetical protein
MACDAQQVGSRRRIPLTHPCPRSPVNFSFTIKAPIWVPECRAGEQRWDKYLHKSGRREPKKRARLLARCQIAMLAPPSTLPQSASTGRVVSAKCGRWQRNATTVLSSLSGSVFRVIRRRRHLFPQVWVLGRRRKPKPMSAFAAAQFDDLRRPAILSCRRSPTPFTNPPLEGSEGRACAQARPVEVEKFGAQRRIFRGGVIYRDLDPSPKFVRLRFQISTLPQGEGEKEYRDRHLFPQAGAPGRKRKPMSAFDGGQRDGLRRPASGFLPPHSSLINVTGVYNRSAGSNYYRLNSKV